MNLIRYLLLTCGWLLAVCTGATLAQSGAPNTAAKPVVTLQMPALPEPVPVTVTAATTALLVFDMVDPICTTQPKCMATMVPAVTSLLAKARSAGVFVLYATRGPTLSKWITQVAPTPGDPVMQSYAQDRFYNTDLDKTLKDKGIKTLILAGWKVSGSVTYTSVGATARGYNVVVPQDASLATTDYETAIGVFQILNQFDANATNEPLKPHRYDHNSMMRLGRQCPLYPRKRTFSATGGMSFVPIADIARLAWISQTPDPIA